MCGIAGLVDYRVRSDANHLNRMIEVLNHRGPDDQGQVFDVLEQAQVGLAHARLSILDLSVQGHQPFVFQHLTMVYNGEVYNYQEIRLELESLGYDFESESDTEVVLKAYHQWGISCVDQLNGMFALAIWDGLANQLILLRDRAGVKPLFWYQHQGLFLFASELKSFHQHPDFQKELNHDALGLFLQYGYIPQPYSIFQQVHKLSAGHYLTLDLISGDVTIEKYWDIIDCYNQPKLELTDQEAIDQVEAAFRSACRYRMVSDVPVGMFLSGGYDSSAVAAMIQTEQTRPLKTFSIGFHEQGYNEAEFAKVIAAHLGTDHTEYYCTQQDALDLMPFLPEIWDEPFADPSAIPTTLVSRLAREQVTVSLSADGGDEVFGGYNKYQMAAKTQANWFAQQAEILWQGYAQKLPPEVARHLQAKQQYLDALHQSTVSQQSEQQVNVMQRMQQFFSDEALDQLLRQPSQPLKTGFDEKGRLAEDLLGLDKMMAIDFKTYQLDEILVKVDRATMSVGLEGREPMLDRHLVELMARLPTHLKIRGNEKKYLLKQITHQYIPKHIMERPKMGFNLPLAQWLRDQLRPYLMVYLNPARLEKSGLFNVSFVVDLRDRLLRGEQVSVNQLWNILMFEMWREKWL